MDSNNYHFERGICMLTGYLEINEKYLLTVTEASKYFNVGPRQIQKVIEENEGNFALQLDGKDMIIRENFEAYLQRLAVKIINATNHSFYCPIIIHNYNRTVTDIKIFGFF